MFRIDLEKLTKKTIVAIAGITLSTLSLFSIVDNTTETKAMWHSGWTNYGYRGDKQAVSQANSEWQNGGYIGVSAFIDGGFGRQGYVRRYGMGTQTAYSGWGYGTAYAYWHW